MNEEDMTETEALLKILELGNAQIENGQVVKAEEVLEDIWGDEK